jgi:repressor LexA
MIEEGIFERDLVVVRRQDDARNGDLVAAMVEGEATVKRIKFQRPDIHLIPANPAYREQIYPSESVSIVGRVIGLLRTYA